MTTFHTKLLSLFTDIWALMEEDKHNFKKKKNEGHAL